MSFIELTNVLDSIKILKTPSQNIQELEHLDISHKNFDEYRFKIICEGLQKLKILTAIDPGKLVTGESLKSLSPFIEEVFIGLNHMIDPNNAIKSLISGYGKNIVNLGLVVDNFQDINWNLISENMKILKCLKLSFGSNGYGSLEAIGKLCDLECLILVENSKNVNGSVLNDDSLLHIIKGCKKLKSFSLAEVKTNICHYTHNSISKIPLYLRNLTQLRFLNGINVLDKTLVDLANLEKIRVLHLSLMNSVTDNGVIYFVNKTKKTLTKFRVSGCNNITYDIIKPFIEIANDRPNEEIKVYLENINQTQFNTINFDELPLNLIVEIKNVINQES